MTASLPLPQLLDEYFKESLKCILSKQFGVFTSNFGHTRGDRPNPGRKHELNQPKAQLL
jgi:hypothetical protein